MRRFYTQHDFDRILKRNPLGCPVTFGDREGKKLTDNFIVYDLNYPQGMPLKADDKVHVPSVTVTVYHYHKNKLDAGAIRDFMARNFITEAAQTSYRNYGTDYWMTIFTFTIYTNYHW